MKWSEVTVHTSQEAVEAVSHVLHEAGASGVSIEDKMDFTKERDNRFGEIYEVDANQYPEEGVRIKAYFAINDTFDQLLEQIRLSVSALSSFGLDIGANLVTASEVDEEDWATAWKQYYHPIKVSDTFTIVPTWEEYIPEVETERIIELDPGMAFGTGTHPTTIMCIQALEKIVQQGDLVIDVGTGSGILSIAAAKLGAAAVQAYDLDEVAVESAQMNVELNKVDDAVTVGQNNLLQNIEGPVDVIVANLLADIILLFPHDAARVLKPGGLFITSGIIAAKHQDVREGLEKVGFTIEEVMTMEDWVAIIARNKA